MDFSYRSIFRYTRKYLLFRFVNNGYKSNYEEPIKKKCGYQANEDEEEEEEVEVEARKKDKKDAYGERDGNTCISLEKDALL
jgi:hypothetical protein